MKSSAPAKVEQRIVEALVASSFRKCNPAYFCIIGQGRIIAGRL